MSQLKNIAERMFFRQARIMKRGFTLVEVLIAIAIFGVLASLTSYVYSSALQRSRDSQRLTDLDTIRNALEQYYLDNRHYPANDLSYPRSPGVLNSAAKWQLEKYKSSVCSNTVTDENALAPHYLSTIPEDPMYQFTVNSTCRGVVPKSGLTQGFGQYLYLSSMKTASDTKPQQYWLFARVERSIHVSDFVPAESSSDYFAWNIFNRSTFVSSNSLCDSSRNNSGTAAPECSHNYYLQESNND